METCATVLSSSFRRHEFEGELLSSLGFARAGLLRGRCRDRDQLPLGRVELRKRRLVRGKLLLDPRFKKMLQLSDEDKKRFEDKLGKIASAPASTKRTTKRKVKK